MNTVYRIPNKKSNVLHVHCYSNLDAISGERMMRREGSVGGVALLHALEPWLVLPVVNLSVIVIFVILIVVIMIDNKRLATLNTRCGARPPFLSSLLAAAGPG